MFVTARKLLASNKGFCAGATSLGLAYLVSEGVDGKHASCTNRIYAAAASLGNRVSYSFGNNLFGQLGLGNDQKQIAPMVIDSLPQNEDVSFIDAGYDQSAFVTTSGKLFTAGCGAHCRLGLGRSDSNQTVPQAVEGLPASNVKSVAVGGFHMLCLCENGEVYSFGRNNLAQLGHHNTEPGKATKINDAPFGGKKVVQVSAGRMHSAALLETGEVYTWGNGRDGALGHGDKSKQSEPKLVEKLKGMTAIHLSVRMMLTPALTFRHFLTQLLTQYCRFI